MKKALLLLLAILSIQGTNAQDTKKYNHILITNDDGVEDADRLLALAEHVQSVAHRVSIIVSSFDRSGFSNHTTFGKHKSTIEIKCRYHDEEKNIYVYSTPDNPADCVLIGLNGLFPHDKPDLVLSGINGGANIGPRWFGSGTIGANCTAAFLGVKGIALSGFDDDDPRSFKVIPKWVTTLISSNFVDEIDKNSYLTIGFPDVPLDSVKGTKVAQRRVSFDNPNSIVFHQVVGENPHAPENKSVWSVKYEGALNNASDRVNDDNLLEDGYIVITPMTIDENDLSLNVKLNGLKDEIPKLSIGEK